MRGQVAEEVRTIHVQAVTDSGLSTGVKKQRYGRSCRAKNQEPA